MSNSALIHAAVFAAGAIIGGGVAAAVTSSIAPKRPQPIAVPAVVPLRPSSTAIVETGPRGAFISNRELELPPVLKYGNPGPVADTLIRKAYAAAYDRRLRHPAWTAEHLTVNSFKTAPGESSGDRQKSTFHEDESLPAQFRSTIKDYFRSGYDRGHMVPAADAKFSQEAMNETFLLSNIAPQVGDGFNRHYWAYLEEWCRRLTGTFPDVFVFTVPLYLPRSDADGKWRVTYEVIGSPPNVAVPTHFAKVVLASRPVSPSKPDILELAMGAFVLPNAIIPDTAPLEQFAVPVEAVERAAGLTLFSDAVKAGSKQLCRTTNCQLVVRRFDDAAKKPKAIAAPR